MSPSETAMHAAAIQMRQRMTGRTPEAFGSKRPRMKQKKQAPQQQQDQQLEDDKQNLRDDAKAKSEVRK